MPKSKRKFNTSVAKIRRPKKPKAKDGIVVEHSRIEPPKKTNLTRRERKELRAKNA